ncbi:MAG: sucrose synthase, partial [Deltaproteobacteria bacterium HGW-Deltaproteobacteria-16]
MADALSNFIDEQEAPFLLEFIFSIPVPETSILLRNDVLLAFEAWSTEQGKAETLPGSWRFLRKVQEILCLPEERIVVYRHRKASCRFFVMKKESEALSLLNAREFLAVKERLVNPGLPTQQRTMELNLAPFYDYGPSLKDPNTIGHGIRHLNRYLSANLASQPEKWQKALYEFLKLHQLHGVQLLLDGGVIRNVGELETALEYAMDAVERTSGRDDMVRLKNKLRPLGFLDGWGNSPARILETMNLLQDILEQPNEETLEEFLARIPMVSK